MVETRLVVVGANAAGMSAAHQALRGAKSRDIDLNVIVLEATGDTSYSACGIPYWLAGDLDDPADLVARSADKHRALGIDLRTGVTAVDLDLAGRSIRYRDADGQHVDLPFDELVLATGASAVTPDWALDESGELVRGVAPVKHLDDGRDWLRRLRGSASVTTDAGPKPRGVVVGGGYIGIEMAETLVRRGFDTTLVTRTRVMSHLDPDMSERITSHLADAGVLVLQDTPVDALRVSSDGSVDALVTAGGQVLPADVIVVGIGIDPNTELGAAAGIPLGESRGYVPDERGRIADSVWAAGDCCEVLHRMTGKYTFLPLGTHANKQGRVVGENLSGGDVTFGGALGTAITRFATDSTYVEISRTGLSTAEATAAGHEVTSLTTEGTTASDYMPEATPIAIRVIADSSTRRLLGMQIVGGNNAGKRIDTAAACLWGAMTVDDLAWMDLSYAPPFATAWEVVQIAARRLAERLP